MAPLLRAWLVLASVLVASSALASGFALSEQSAEASALAGAWVARADDAAANWYNPAALARLDGMQLQFGGAFFQASGNTELNSGDAAWGLDPATPSDFEATGEGIAAPHVYFSQRIGQQWAWGVGLNRPFGFSREWSERPVTFATEKAELGTYAVNLNGAWAINEFWSLGAGITYLTADLETFSREVAVNLDNDPSTVEATGRSNLNGSGSDIGFVLAGLYATPGFSAALVYRSSISPTLDGDLTFAGFGPAQALFPDSPAQVVLDLPAELVGGVAWGAADTWRFELDVSWTEWSRFKTLRIDALDESPPFVLDTRLRQDWDDAIAYHLGVSWQFAEGHEARGGLLQDQGVVPDDTRRATLPDPDRVGVAFGYGYSGPVWSMDAYAMAAFFTEATANGDPGEGIVDGRYRSSGLSLGATVTRRF
jgi:long-chain fatty acid transport protein